MTNVPNGLTINLNNMLPEDFSNRNKLDTKYYIALVERDEYEPETPTQKRIRLVRERKQKFNKNLKSFIGGVK